MESNTESEYSGGIQKIPEDILVENIFMILPASSVMAVRGVSKSWRSLTTGPSFVRAHIRLHCHDPTTADAKSLIVQLQPSPLSEIRRLDVGIDGNQISDRNVEILFPPDCNQATECDFYIKACCDGLLCFEASYPEETYFICNPVTKTWTTVATLSPNKDYALAMLVGFYFHGPTQEYRLLKYFREGDYNPPNGVFGMGYEVATVNGPLWRTIYKRSCANDSRGFLQDMSNFDTALAVRSFSTRAVVINGNLHWQPRSTLQIIVFDTVVEEFKEMNTPSECMRMISHHSRVISEIGGNLCIGVHKVLMSEDIEMDIWLLKDYELQQWTKLHRVVSELGSIKALPEKDKEIKMLMKHRDGFSLYNFWRNTSCHLHMPHAEQKKNVGQCYVESLVML